MAVDEQCLRRGEERARTAYRSPGRFYHDERHLTDCLEQLEPLELKAEERRLLRWAILWHDCIYNPQRKDNEERSAAAAKRALLKCGVDRAQAEEVERLILLTSSHEAGPDDHLGAILISINLSILGSEANRYRDYANAVRREYAAVPDEAWRLGRAAVLKRLLAADPLYPEPNFRERLEARAKANLQAELKSLRGG